MFRLYEQVRASPDTRSAWELWRETRERLYREHPQPPVPPEQRDNFAGCSFFEYEAEQRMFAPKEAP